MMMTRQTHILRKVSGLSQLLSVRGEEPYIKHRSRRTNNHPELELDEEGTRISLTIVDTPGFGDQIDNEARYGY